LVSRITKFTKKNNSKLQKKKIQKILVPLDGSKFSFHALDFAVNLAKFTGSKIIGVFVISSDASPMPVDDFLDPLSAINPVGYKEKMTKQGNKILEQAENKCIVNKIHFTRNLSFGNPANNIVKYAENKNNDIGLIIMGSRSHGHAGEILLGSVSYNVVHKSKKPVTIIK
jgi:nucleotide-binding universal stress UspA family protein